MSATGTMARGVEAAMQTLNMPLVEKTTYKRGATDFSSQVVTDHAKP